MAEQGSTPHPHKKNQGGNRIFDNTDDVDQAPRNRPKKASERRGRQAEEKAKRKQNKKRPGRRQR